MTFPDIDPAAIAEAVEPTPTRYEAELTETIGTIERLVKRLIDAKSKAELAHISWQGMFGNAIPCGKNKRAIPGGWIGTGPRTEPECGKCQKCHEKASYAARGAEIALESIIERAVAQQCDIEMIEHSARIAGATGSNRLGKSDMDTRYGGYHD